MTTIGFTGTRNGMTPEQKQTLERLLQTMPVDFFRHGDCVGADAEAVSIVNSLHTHPWIVCHPPMNTSDRAYAVSDEVRPPLGYFARNREIVRGCDLLIGASFGPAEHPSGGTWYTIRYAQKVGKPVIVIWPDGTIEQRCGVAAGGAPEGT